MELWVIIGGGFAGLKLISTIDRYHSSNIRTILIDCKEYALDIRYFPHAWCDDSEIEGKIAFQYKNLKYDSCKFLHGRYFISNQEDDVTAKRITPVQIELLGCQNGNNRVINIRMNTDLHKKSTDDSILNLLESRGVDKIIYAYGRQYGTTPSFDYKQNLYGIKTLTDWVTNFRRLLKEKEVRKCAILGGGATGLETAGILSDAGLEVHVILRGNNLFTDESDKDLNKNLLSQINKTTRIKFLFGHKMIEEDHFEEDPLIPSLYWPRCKTKKVLKLQRSVLSAKSDNNSNYLLSDIDFVLKSFCPNPERHPPRFASDTFQVYENQFAIGACLQNKRIMDMSYVATDHGSSIVNLIHNGNNDYVIPKTQRSTIINIGEELGVGRIDGIPIIGYKNVGSFEAKILHNVIRSTKAANDLKKHFN